MRAPSSFHSTLASPTSAIASATEALVEASIGCTARSGRSPTSSTASCPSASAISATAPRSPASMTARRTIGAGMPAAAATASVTTPASAPVRISPTNSRPRKSASAAVAREKRRTSCWRRAPCDPAPVVVASTPTASSTSATVRLASGAGGQSSERIEAQPMPMRPWRTSPSRNPTTTGTSAGSSSANSPASASRFAVRLLVAPTASAAATTWPSRVTGCTSRPARDRPPRVPCWPG